MCTVSGVLGFLQGLNKNAQISGSFLTSAPRVPSNRHRLRPGRAVARSPPSFVARPWALGAQGLRVCKGPKPYKPPTPSKAPKPYNH